MKINLLELSGLKSRKHSGCCSGKLGHCICGSEEANQVLKDLSTIDIELDRKELLKTIRDVRRNQITWERKGYSNIRILNAIISNPNKIIKVVKK